MDDYNEDNYFEDRNHKQPYYSRNNRYSDAYGSYTGGYGPDGGFGGPPPFFDSRSMAPGPMFGPPMWGPRFGPLGPFGPPGPPGPPCPPNYRKPMEDRDKISKFLIHCGIPNEAVRSLPKVALQQMKRTRCGVCSVEFESFHIARTHYLSKNHTKNIKKFAMRQGNSPSEKQQPMRARELYCELCDMTVTSRSHADAHYAGKQHRAIVEGRKKPKNTALLQRGMEGRIEQLIKREKKWLNNNVNEAGAGGAGKSAGAGTVAAPPPPPELYCAICETTVSCSEQMRMHLNGKKHLTKEKRHILNMMNGQIQPSPEIRMEQSSEVRSCLTEDKVDEEKVSDDRGDI